MKSGAICRSREGGLLLEVDLVAPEVEQLGVHDRQAGLPACLCGYPGDHVAGQDELDLVASHHLCNHEVLGIVKHSDDVVGLLAPRGVVHQGQNRLDYARVGVLPLRRKDHDGPRCPVVDYLEIDEFVRAAGATDYPRRLRVGYPGPDLVLHLHLVALRQHGYAGVLQARIGLDKLFDDGEDLRGPAKDDRMAGLGHECPALPELFQFGIDAAGDDADEGSHHEYSADCNREHGQQEGGTALVTPHRTRVERPHQAGPGYPRKVPAVRIDTGRFNEEGNGEYQQDRDDEEHDDHRTGATGYQVVRPVAQLRPETDISHVEYSSDPVSES